MCHKNIKITGQNQGKNRSKIMIFDDFLKGLTKHINAEAVTGCHGPTRWSQQLSKPDQNPYYDI